MFNILKQYQYKKYSITLVVAVLLLGLTGAYLIRQVQTPSDGNLCLRHLVGLIGGLILALVVSLFDYHFICAFYILMYLFNLLLLILVKVNGKTLNYAKRWVIIAGIQFQPSELSKVLLILFFSMLFTKLRHKINNFFVLLLSLILICIPVYFILDQPNLSTSLLIMFIFCAMIFAAGLSWKIILPVLFIGIPAFLGLLWYVQQDYQILLKPYQRNRVMSVLHPDEHPETMFQQDNSVTAIGSGQLYGKAFTDNTNIRNYDYVPISESDFIFSVAGEEFGFIGSCFILLIYGVVIYICLRTAQRAPDYLGMLISVGIASMFMFQVFINIGVATSLLPNTGIPLPFMSYGLSSMISSMLAVGLILNIRIQPPPKIRGNYSKNKFR